MSSLAADLPGTIARLPLSNSDVADSQPQPPLSLFGVDAVATQTTFSEQGTNLLREIGRWFRGLQSGARNGKQSHHSELASRQHDSPPTVSGISYFA